jgi:hypothetical protein
MGNETTSVIGVTTTTATTGDTLNIPWSPNTAWSNIHPGISDITTAAPILSEKELKHIRLGLYTAEATIEKLEENMKEMQKIIKGLVKEIKSLKSRKDA